MLRQNFPFTEPSQFGGNQVNKGWDQGYNQYNQYGGVNGGNYGFINANNNLGNKPRPPIPFSTTNVN